MDETKASAIHQREYWRATAEDYRAKLERQVEEAKYWRTWSIWWFCAAGITVTAFWFEVWRHARHG